MDYYDLNKNETFLISTRAFIRDKDKILILKVPDFREGDFVGEWNDKWSTPGGLLEMHEDLKDSLIREIKEETGLDIKIKKLFGLGEMFHKGFVFKDKRKLNIRVIELGFLCDYIGGAVTLSEEHSEFKWATKNELAELQFSPDSKDLLEQYIKSNE